jgi:hypothetical protein
MKLYESEMQATGVNGQRTAWWTKDCSCPVGHQHPDYPQKSKAQIAAVKPTAADCPLDPAPMSLEPKN